MDMNRLLFARAMSKLLHSALAASLLLRRKTTVRSLPLMTMGLLSSMRMVKLHRTKWVRSTDLLQAHITRTQSSQT
ncbi:hypothetical protein D3C87_1370000 [compost metagenome]